MNRKELRRCYKAATLIAANLRCAPSAQDFSDLSDACRLLQEKLKSLVENYEKARDHGWFAAAQIILENQLSYVHHNSAVFSIGVKEALARCKNKAMFESSRSPVGQIASDIVALYDEFDDVCIDFDLRTLSVTTPSIILEDVALGRFEIRLSWSQIVKKRPYCVVALEPNRPSDRDDITHPHVQDDALCAGDGEKAISKALHKGHIYEFFLIVGQILDTYNPTSAFIRLSKWQNAVCQDCGNEVLDDEILPCGDCGIELCGSCMTRCEGCNDEFCSEHIAICSDCNNSFCGNCLTSCAECGNDFCPGCLADEDETLCQGCYEEKKENEEEEEEDQSDDDDSEPTDSKTCVRAVAADAAGHVAI